MVAIGEKDFRDSHTGDFRKVLVARRHWIDAKIPLSVANDVTVEVVPVWLGKPHPGENVVNDLLHGVASLQRKDYCAPEADVRQRRDARQGRLARARRWDFRKTATIGSLNSRWPSGPAARTWKTFRYLHPLRR